MLNAPFLFGHYVGFTLLTNLHNDWIKRMVLGEDDETLQAHRGSYKTTAVSIALVVIIILFPNDKTAFIRKSDGDVREIIDQVKKILEHKITKYIVKTIYGVNLELTRSNGSEITTNLTNDPRGTSQLVGRGIKGSLTGKHFDRIFTDDIVNVSDRTSRAEREHTKTVYQELQNIKNRGGRIFNTGTPWHKEDAFCIMPNPQKYDCYSTGLVTAQQIDELKARMVNSLFAANYELKHVASEDVIFRDAVTGGDDKQLINANHCHVDAAYGGEDSTAFTIAKKVGTTYFVLGKLYNKHVDEAEGEIIRLYQKYCVKNLYCEENADKGYLKKEFRKCGVRAVGYSENTNKYLKIVTYLKSEWNNIVFVDGTDKEYIEQILEFNENAPHDDAPDSLACIIRMLWQKKPDDDRIKAVWD